MSEPVERGLALLCDERGLILRVLRNDLNLTGAVPGRLFLRLVDDASRVKALDFLIGLKTQGAIWNWELHVSEAERLITLHFSGGEVDGQLLIVGAGDGEVAARLYEEMMHISNEQTNLLRAALKETSRVAPANLELDLYDEISRLNNELVSMQRELAKKNAELERLNQEKNHFLGMAAHDLRNPLHAIQMASEYLLDQDPTTLGDNYQEFVDIIHSFSQFMAKLVDDLLDVAKIEAGKLQLELDAVDLGALVARNVAINRALAAKKSITIDLHSDPLPQVLVDGVKMEQVLNNLIGNAVKFSPPGSRVEVELTASGPECILSVRDEGPGIPPEEQVTLFQPFHRGQAQGTAGEKSTGLGLVIVKRIVEGHGGRIWLESRVGQGATFLVALPIKLPEA